MKTAAQAKAAWRTGMASAGPAYSQGCQNTSKDPTQLAAAAVDSGFWLQRTSAAAPRMSARLKATPKAVWQQACTTIGAQRLASGATKGGPKYDKAIDMLVPIWQQMAAASAAIPRGGLGAAQAKANAALAVLMQATGKA